MMSSLSAMFRQKADAIPAMPNASPKSMPRVISGHHIPSHISRDIMRLWPNAECASSENEARHDGIIQLVRRWRDWRLWFY
jgi:hypothetical protein